jgi:hypothetical protein
MIPTKENAMPADDLIIVNAKVTTLDRQNPAASDARSFWGALGCGCWAV